MKKICQSSDGGDPESARTSGPVQLTLIGVGCVIGAGIFVMTGSAAAMHAGPAVVLSLVVAAVACGVTAFCHAELAAMLPTSGSSYSYALMTFGKFAGWSVGWLLLEYGIAAAAVAVGFASYAMALLDRDARQCAAAGDRARPFRDRPDDLSRMRKIPMSDGVIFARIGRPSSVPV